MYRKIHEICWRILCKYTVRLCTANSRLNKCFTVIVSVLRFSAKCHYFLISTLSPLLVNHAFSLPSCIRSLVTSYSYCIAELPILYTPFVCDLSTLACSVWGLYLSSDLAFLSVAMKISPQQVVGIQVKYTTRPSSVCLWHLRQWERLGRVVVECTRLWHIVSN